MQKQGSRKVQLAEKGRSPDYSITAGYMLMPVWLHESEWLYRRILHELTLAEPRQT